MDHNVPILYGSEGQVIEQYLDTDFEMHTIVFYHLCQMEFRRLANQNGSE